MADAFQKNAFQNNAFGIAEGAYLAATDKRDVAAFTLNVIATPITLAAVEAQDGALRATFNPLDKATNVVLSNNNRTAVTSVPGTNQSVRSIVCHSSGKHYFEMQISGQSAGYSAGIGLATKDLPLDGGNPGGWVGGTYHSFGIYVPLTRGDVWGAYQYDNAAGYIEFTTVLAAIGEWLGFAVDFDTGQVWFRNADGWEGDPVAGTGSIVSVIPRTAFFVAGCVFSAADSITANLTAADFAYPIPAGFIAWDNGIIDAFTANVLALGKTVTATAYNPNDRHPAVLLANDGTRTYSETMGAMEEPWTTQCIRSVVAHATGKHYVEFRIDAESGVQTVAFGLSTSNGWLDGWLGYDNDLGVNRWSMGIYEGATNSDVNYNNSSNLIPLPYGIGDWIGMAVDLDSRKVWFRNAAGWYGDPVAGTGTIFTLPPGITLHIITELFGIGDAATTNFGDMSFAYAPPAGYKSWSAAPAFNQNDKSAFIALSNNNRTTVALAGMGAWAIARSVQGHSTGKYYFEGIPESVGAWAAAVGLVAGDNPLNDWYLGQPGTPNWSLGYYPNGHVYTADTGAMDTLKPYTDRWVGLAVDFDTGRVWVRNYDGWNGDPAAGTGWIGDFTPGVAFYAATAPSQPSTKSTVNFGSTPFAYAPPVGFNAWIVEPAVEAKDISAISAVVISHQLTLAVTDIKDTAAFGITLHVAGGIILGVQEAIDVGTFAVEFFPTNDLVISVFPGTPDIAAINVTLSEDWYMGATEQRDVSAIMVEIEYIGVSFALTEVQDFSEIEGTGEPRVRILATEAKDTFGWGPDVFQRDAFQLYAFGGINLHVMDFVTLGVTEGFKDTAAFTAMVTTEMVLDAIGQLDVSNISIKFFSEVVIAATETTDQAVIVAGMGDGIALTVTEPIDVAAVSLDLVDDLLLFARGEPDQVAIVLDLSVGLRIAAIDVPDTCEITLARFNVLYMAAVERQDIPAFTYRDFDDEIVCVRSENRVFVVPYEDRISHVTADSGSLFPNREPRRSDTYNRRRVC